MKTYVSIGGIFVKDVGERVFSQLIQIAPHCQRGAAGHAFLGWIDEDDPRVSQIEMILRTAGLRRNDPRKKQVRGEHYFYKKIREYEESDFASSEYLEIRSGPENDFGGRNKDGVTGLRVQPDRPICGLMASTGFFCIVVSDDVKKLIERLEVRGAVFNPVKKHYVGASPRLVAHEESWWELRSSQLMPPMSDVMQYARFDRSEYDGDDTHGCVPVEYPYSQAELHYKRSDIDQMEPIDVAFTAERFGVRNLQEYDRYLIISQRLCQVLKEAGYTADYAPIRIDDD